MIDCTQCREWELCPFHPKASAPVLLEWHPPLVLPDGSRLLGLDDPEVSTDRIYATPTGGFVAVAYRGSR